MRICILQNTVDHYTGSLGGYFLVFAMICFAALIQHVCSTPSGNTQPSLTFWTGSPARTGFESHNGNINPQVSQHLPL
jgi:hypothetical protein